MISKMGLMGKNRRKRGFFTAFVLLSLALASCVPTKNSGSSSSSGRRSGVSNTQDSVSAGYGRLLEANPVVVSGNPSLSFDANLNLYLDSEQDFIVLDQHLNGDCTFNGNTIAPCLRVKKSRTASQTNNPSAKWAYPTDTLEFLEVNTFGHMQRLKGRYHDALAANFANTSPFSTYESNIPSSLVTNKAYWFGGSNKELFGYSNCDSTSAFFDPAKKEVCLGRSSKDDQFKWAQDPSVIYHEMGHAFTEIFLNMRNVAAGNNKNADLKNFFYDEGGAIDEGVADYASYAMNGRSHIGEWAMGRFNQSRPLSEAEGIHSSGINTSFTGRLSYPTYINYDPNFPDDPIEDIHYAGQIISHYLVALTKDLQNHCSYSNLSARKKVVEVLAESFAELGDLTAKGSDDGDHLVGHINHSPEHSDEWLRIVNPINFRSFAQSMARSVKKAVVDSSCNYTQDDHEKLLDSYGLLLFETYNRDGNHSTAGHSNNPAEIEVADANQIKTVLINKDLIKLDPEENASQGFIFDNRSDMVNAYESMDSRGQINGISTLIGSDLPYNNGNGQVSPGEFVGITLNLYNDSNSTMGGVQVLANDWDHVKWDTSGSKPYYDGKACNNFADGFPLDSEGAADTSGESGTTPGECKYITRENGDEADEQLAPVCFIQINDDNATRWAVQDEFRQEINLDSSKCLGENRNECFLRAVEGAESAFYAKIDPKSTWAETVTEGDESPNFNFSNLLYFEVSPWVPPGTKFSCRLRVRFSNCKQCYHDEDHNDDDYLDYEYSGAEPFKIINFQFTVID